MQCQRVCDFPVVLDEQSVVVVSQPDLVSLRREPADSQKKEESGIDGAELLVVGLRGEKLIILEVAFHAIHASTFIVPPEFESMAIESLRKAGAEGTVFLLKSRGCECSAIAELALIAEYCKSTVRAEQIEECVGTAVRECRAGKIRLATIFAMNIRDKRTSRAQRGPVTETEKNDTATQI